MLQSKGMSKLQGSERQSERADKKPSSGLVFVQRILVYISTVKAG